ncbi:pyridoxamine 5'-phosphate oxidase family protein [Desulfonema magnum]|uniref:Pyridoxamine-phosphate oxidase domain-containing protein n=1 Tax=Desulfonema magnum TaxID=45655 RepID=A0A975GS75_9BACT|nr:pyridoxamine 5'-phosphate oxidase family protein [Desulfonema magnum]QTA90793.1 Pyridoxamine-phosphate oxidase domain-containing protein [Desulfonema magnum]
MNLKDYFENTKGTGVLATADSEGRTDAAVFARPHILEDGTVAMIMRDRLTHKNLQSNPHATYLFMEQGPGYKGIRLFLTKTGEEEETERLYSLRRKTYSLEAEDTKGPKFLVIFKLDKELPLIGPGEPENE